MAMSTKATEIIAGEFQIGDQVRIKADTYNHFFPVGTIVKLLTWHSPSFSAVPIDSTDEVADWKFVHPRDMERIERGDDHGNDT
jgi:hypothetical protein